MASKDTNPGNHRKPYKLVAVVKVLIDGVDDENTLAGIAKHLLTKEVVDLLDGASFTVEEIKGGFNCAVESIDLVETKELN